MALGTDMKSLVDDILASREDRAKAVENIRKETRHIQSDARSMMKDFAKGDEERAQEVNKLGLEVKSFLKSSAESRKVDFSVTMKTVREDSRHARNAGKTIVKDARALVASIAKDNKEQAKELHEELKKSDNQRKTEFKSMMGEIGEDLKEVKGDVAKVKKDTRDTVSRYHHSRISGQKHWASLSQGRKKAKGQKSEE